MRVTRRRNREQLHHCVPQLHLYRAASNELGAMGSWTIRVGKFFFLFF
jgi:hypothetical protein